MLSLGTEPVRVDAFHWGCLLNDSTGPPVCCLKVQQIVANKDQHHCLAMVPLVKITAGRLALSATRFDGRNDDSVLDKPAVIVCL